MIFGSVLKWIFLDKNARKAAKKITATRAASARESSPGAGTETETGDDRDKLIKETMALYRQKRVEYQQLDEGVRDRLAKLADDALRDTEK